MIVNIILIRKIYTLLYGHRCPGSVIKRSYIRFVCASNGLMVFCGGDGAESLGTPTGIMRHPSWSPRRDGWTQRSSAERGPLL